MLTRNLSNTNQIGIVLCETTVKTTDGQRKKLIYAVYDFKKELKGAGAHLCLYRHQRYLFAWLKVQQLEEIQP